MNTKKLYISMKYNFKQYKLIIKCNTRIRDNGGEKISHVLDLK